MSFIDSQIDQAANTVDWSKFYTDLATEGHVPDASCAVIDTNQAIFRGMYQNLADINRKILESDYAPSLTVIYADVLAVPANTNWVLATAGLIIYARLMEVEGDASVILNYEQNAAARLVVFGSEMTGNISVKTVFDAGKPPTIFNLNQTHVSPGFTVYAKEKTATCDQLSLNDGFGMQVGNHKELYLNNSYIFASLLYDQKPVLAVAMFLWVKGWAAQSNQLQELFYRSTSMATLLNSELNAQINGARFVPYLTSGIYTNLANAFAKEAAKYESNYMTLSTQKLLTEENIATAKTMVENSQDKIDYVNALLQQANENYNNAETAAKNAMKNFEKQQQAVNFVAVDFEKIGIPEYQRKVIISGMFDLVKTVVTFGGAIVSMAAGNATAAPAAATGAVNGAKAVADATSTGTEIANIADTLAKAMKKLKKLVGALQKVYNLAKTVKDIADRMGSAEAEMGVVQKMKDTTDGADLSAASGWAVFQIQADKVIEGPVKLGIKYAKHYKEAMNILVVYGQALSAAQLAVIKAGQHVADLKFQLYYEEEKKAHMQHLVANLKVNEAPGLAMMQQFYQKYLNSKSSLFAALKLYQASYFYWALAESDVQPKIIDSVDRLSAGIQNITKIAMDKVTALERFDPPPQKMENMIVSICTSSALKTLKSKRESSWIISLDNAEFLGLERVRLNDMRVWLEGTQFTDGNNAVFMTITNTGNYLDRYQGIDYQFNSKELVRTFKYKVSDSDINADWKFENGSWGAVQIDGEVDKEVSYAYFRPTPFSEWKITLLTEDNPGVDFSEVTKITMYFAGSAIGATS